MFANFDFDVIVRSLPYLFYDGMALSEDRRRQLRDKIKAALPATRDGTIPLRARAFAVRGVNRAPGR